MKRGLVCFPSDEVAAIRISIAFLFLSPLLLKHSKIEFKKYFPGLVLMGVFGNFIPAFLFTKAETQISSSLTGMLNALTPLFTIIISTIWLANKPGKTKLIGVLMGFLAAVGLVLFNDSPDTSKNVWYSLLVLVATLCYAISINGIRHYLSDLDSVKAAVWAFVIIGPMAIIYLFGLTDFTTHVQKSGAIESIGYVAILAILGTALSVIAFNRLIKMSNATFASSCTYLIPIVAIGWGLIDGENVSQLQLLSIGLIIFSVYLINKPQKFAE
jgi:drug/metabolite transporter (DMT)-like permease